MTRPDLLLAALDAVAQPHRGGHRCTDGGWYNENAGTRTPCQVTLHLRTAREQAHRLHDQVHEAAHDTAAAEHVAEAMTGLVMADLSDDDRAGWTTTARMAIEGLSEWLDRDPVADRRRASIRDRLAAAGLGDPTEPTGATP